MDAIRRSFQLFGASLRVLRARRELLAFPLLSAAAILATVVTFLVPVICLSWNELGEGEGLTGTSWLLLLLLYFTLAAVVVYFNAALVHAADQALRGEDPDVRESLRAAARRWPAVLAWSAISATVSLVLRGLEDRLGFVGRVAMALAGMAWALVTYLILPLVVLEGIGVREALRRSNELFRQTWGEQAVGRIGISVAALFVGLVGIPILLVGVTADSSVLSALFLVLACAWWLGVAAGAGALSGVYQTVLYRYAAWKRVPREFGKVDLAQHFPAREEAE